MPELTRSEALQQNKYDYVRDLGKLLHRADSDILSVTLSTVGNDVCLVQGKNKCSVIDISGDSKLMIMSDVLKAVME